MSANYIGECAKAWWPPAYTRKTQRWASFMHWDIKGQGIAIWRLECDLYVVCSDDILVKDIFSKANDSIVHCKNNSRLSRFGDRVEQTIRVPSGNVFSHEEFINLQNYVPFTTNKVAT